jgi:NACalpha-BTF3-like transcription factor
MKKFNVVIYVPSVQIYTGVIEAENEEEAASKALEAKWVEGSDDYTVEDDYLDKDDIQIVVDGIQIVLENFEEQKQ